MHKKRDGYGVTGYCGGITATVAVFGVRGDADRLRRVLRSPRGVAGTWNGPVRMATLARAIPFCKGWSVARIVKAWDDHKLPTWRG